MATELITQYVVHLADITNHSFLLFLGVVKKLGYPLCSPLQLTDLMGYLILIGKLFVMHIQKSKVLLPLVPIRSPFSVADTNYEGEI